MKKIILMSTILFSLLYLNLSFAEEKNNNKNTQLNFYTGMFDYSDHGQRAMLFGFQHQNEDLKRKTFAGILSPITGGFFTENSAVYVYSGVEWNFDLGKLNLTPSFAPGLYGEGDGKDLGHILEFKTEIQASFDISKNSSLGMSYNHISNASLGDKNPGANSYTFNFLKKF
tara:strand:+ start:1220 stop:1732 length:513 start_codon:yes stop_codon:yes gene_type:complete